MKKVWITYAWADNENGDVDYLAQELRALGLEVEIDKSSLTVGKRIWEQLDKFITDPSRSDAWIWYATQNSLGSEACKEEYSYAIGRALKSREKDFPIITVFPGPVDDDLIPAGVGARLYVSLREDDHLERILSGVECRAPKTVPPVVDPFEFQIHEVHEGPFKFAIEVRPRAGVWAPCYIGVPEDEAKMIGAGMPVGIAMKLGPKGIPPDGLYFDMMNVREVVKSSFLLGILGDECTPTKSLYYFSGKLPSRIAFGAVGDPKKQYTGFVEYIPPALGR